MAWQNAYASELRHQGSGHVVPIFADTVICEKMGWTYQELQDTPESFIVALEARWQVEAKHQASEQKKLHDRLKFSKKR